MAELIRLELKDPRVNLVTLTAVEVSPDYTHAKVLYETQANKEKGRKIERGIKCKKEKEERKSGGREGEVRG